MRGWNGSTGSTFRRHSRTFGHPGVFLDEFTEFRRDAA